MRHISDNELLAMCKADTKWYVLVAGGIVTVALCVLGSIAFCSVG